MSYYVYELIDPRSGSVFYVGKGKGSRVHAHEKEARAGRVSRKCDLIRDIEADGFSIVKRTVRTFEDEQAAYDFEADHIDSIGLHKLTNVATGGGTARNSPTLFWDRQKVRAATGILVHTRGGQISSVQLAGKPFELTSIVNEMVGWVPEIIDRRGLEWVNAISLRQNVTFECEYA